MNTPLLQLREYLATRPAGPISEPGEVEGLLVDCWNELADSDGAGMAAYKLRGRMESVEWTPPILQFTIERHGGTVQGSSRAELQAWDIDFDNGVALHGEVGDRQLTPRARPLDVGPIADEVARLILDYVDDERLKWSSDGSVRILIGKILPANHTPKQTLAGRRKRFRKAVAQKVTGKGWRAGPPNVFQPPGPST